MTKASCVVVCSLLFLVACLNNPKNTIEINNSYNAIKKEFAPDKRVAIFSVDYHFSEGRVMLSGETTSEKALTKFLQKLDSQKITFKNNIRLLPDTIVGENIYAVGNNSVINIRSSPSHSSELGTQGLLGMPLKVFDKKGDFYRVQTPDHYISWVDKGGIRLMNAQEFEQWNQLKKVIFTKNFGYVYASNKQDTAIISDISLGGIVAYISEDTRYFKIQYPDDRIGYLKKDEAMDYHQWLYKENLTPSGIENIAKSFEGFPYLWGGTSAKGMDCSGFTKMVYYMNGAIIPRDASQQIMAGEIVDKQLRFEGLQKGDLLFFGKKASLNEKQRVTHVGIWLGNEKGEFIHASGNVHLSSILKDQPNYDAFNKNRYLGSRRYLDSEDKNIISLKKQATH